MDVVLVVALWLFAITHLDTLVVLVAFCADEGYGDLEVAVGHYLGFGLGLATAVAATILAAEVLQERAFLLGVLPLALGLWGFLRRRPDSEPLELVDAPERLEQVVVVTIAGIGLSGENVAVYVPFFLTLGAAELGVVVAMYVLGAGVVFLVSLLVVRRTVVAGPPEWVRRWLVPGILTLVGVYVLLYGWLVA